MFLGINFKTEKPLKVLIAPLDWGLGHATRCIPLIQMLLKEGVKVIMAAEGAQAALLKEAFPHLLCLPLQGYRIRYSSQKIWFLPVLLSQFWRVKKCIAREHLWLQQTIDEHKIDVVIADNRFGLHSTKAYCIFITHQLQIITGFSWLNALAQKINYKYIHHYKYCWVPDLADDGIAGLLSHPRIKPLIPVAYIGPLSRMLPIECEEKKYTHLFLISGPEPQRTIFEKKIIQCINGRNKIAVVRGLPEADDTLQIKNVDVFNHLPAAALNTLICNAQTIVCRSGYSTIMDLLATKSKAILIPTPAQTEQEYLAQEMEKNKKFKCLPQKHLNENIFNISCYNPYEKNA